MADKRFGSWPAYNGQRVVLTDDSRLTRPSVQATVDFGFPSGPAEDFTATTSVLAPWVTTNSRIVCSPSGTTTADHDPEDAAVEGITAYAMNVIAGVGFDVVANAPRGTWGRYLINVVG